MIALYECLRLGLLCLAMITLYQWLVARSNRQVLTSNEPPIHSFNGDLLKHSYNYFPLRSGPYHMTMAIKRSDPNDWIQIDQAYHETMKDRRGLLSIPEVREKQVRFIKGSEEGSYEFLQMLCEHLTRRFPNMFKINGDRIVELNSGIAYSIRNSSAVGSDMHPLEIASRLCQEDFLILQQGDDELHRLTAAALVYPSGWNLGSKMGKPLHQIHVPAIPYYKEKLQLSMDRYFAKLQPGSIVERANWMIATTNQGHRPENLHTWPPCPGDSKPLTSENAGECLFLRVERQTLRRLPRTRAVVFSVRTHMRSIADAVGNDIVRIQDLKEAILALPNEMAHYKGRPVWGDALVGYCDARLAVLADKDRSI